MASLPRFFAPQAAQAVILAAGRGTRMKSARPKVLHPLVGVPLLEHVLRSVEALGASPITVVVGHQAEAVEAAFGGRGIQFVRQLPGPLGTGHALQCAREQLAALPDRTVLVLNGDLPLLRPETLAALLRDHKAARPSATLLTMVLEEPGAYGRVLRDKAGEVRAIVEASDASEDQRDIKEVNAGIYAFEVPPLLEVLGGLQPHNAQGEYYLTDLVGLLRSAARTVRALTAIDPAETHGVNTVGELAAVADILRRRRVSELMSQGVSLEDPETIHVGVDVVLEPDAIVRPFTMLEGRTVVRAGASIGPFARVVDSEVGPGAQVLDHCLLRDCVVEAGASIGPFAHLRPESRVGPRAKVGNFVELKKTVLGEGAKAPHLAYLGDATIGARVNVGAGTITCNYDGETKHQTHIEADAFIGSNATLVAPVTVGRESYVGAGSVITQDVPVGSLALGRAHQVVKQGWADKRRQTARRRTQNQKTG